MTLMLRSTFFYNLKVFTVMARYNFSSLVVYETVVHFLINDRFDEIWCMWV